MTFSLDICMLIRLGQVHVSKFKVTGNSQEEKNFSTTLVRLHVTRWLKGRPKMETVNK